MLREREIDQGNERFHSVRNIRERNVGMVQNTIVDPFRLCKKLNFKEFSKF